MQVGNVNDQANVVAALKNAAQATGSDFHYLLGTAMRESSLKPTAQSSTSSAAGLFQFVDQTWLGLVKDHGAKYGLGDLANTITQNGDGHYRAMNDGNRQAIMALEKDPQISALMAGEYAKDHPGGHAERVGPSGLRRRALCRAFSGTRIRLQADPRQRTGAFRQRGKVFSAGRRR